MLHVLTVEATRQVEQAADAAGYPYARMMEDAGRAVADRVLALIADRPQPKITVLVGPGNNGGDGLVAGRLIAADLPAAQVRCVLLTRRDEAADPVYAAALASGLFMAFAEDDHDNRVLRNMVASADVVLDALFGIGARLPLRDAGLKVVRGTAQALNERATARRDRASHTDPTAPAQVERPPRQWVIAVDCPSGLDCDTGDVDPHTLTADETMTFIAAKPGLLTFPGAAKIGRLLVAKLNLPEGFRFPAESGTWLLDHATAQALLPERPADGHKGTFGKALIVAGSVNYTGAAVLAAQAAYRSGAGLVTVGTPAPVSMALAAHLTEATWLLLAHDLGVLSENAADTLRQELATVDALLIGPGLGRETTTRNLLQALLTPRVTAGRRGIGFGADAASAGNTTADTAALPPLVIDADGLNLLAEIDNWWGLLPANTIITPHPGEMARLCGMETAEVQAHRAALAKTKAAEWGVIVVLKGAHTIIAAPDGKTAYSPFKTDALATAGTGDVLAGLIAGLLAQGAAPFAAAQVGVYLHGLAGTLAAADQQNTRSVIAGDVAAAIIPALASLEQIAHAGTAG